MFAVSVPASSANLGPGFDAVGIALELRARAFVEPAAHFSIEFGGPERPTHPGFERMLLAAMNAVSFELPRVRVQVVNAIPLGKGLGSSAAARALGVTIAARAHGLPFDRDAIAQRVCELEGHPDNALPAVCGGIAIAANANASIKLAAPRELRAILVVPEFDLATKQARALLPMAYEKADVVFNIQRAALLGAALASGSWSALRDAMADRIHQPHRAAVVPGLADALAIQDEGLIGVALSGAGPSVLALVHERDAWRPIAAKIEAAFAAAGIASRSLRLPFASRGLVFRKYLTERKAA
ncbi:MAG TPA: homoserine kinase [Candidatus Acidoferrales bacterium]|nr:homoserine kinase [Candidatus Acidoferrales bacterium]